MIWREIGEKHVIKHHEDYDEHFLTVKYELNIHTNIKIEEVFSEETKDKSDK